jgi:cytochrome c551/c552
MEKIVIGILITVSVVNTIELKNSCIGCHQEQKIPSELIYRKYLMKYSDKEAIEDKIFEYIKNPKKENSIMPKQFFLKFPMKSKMDLNITILKKDISDYLELFDVRRRLVLEKSQFSHKN